MKKSFPLEVPGLKPPRVVDALKSEVRRYIKRERRKQLPDEVDFCDFDCRVGPDEDNATEAHVSTLNARIDAATADQWPAVYIEILAKPGYRTKKSRPENPVNE